MRVSGVEGRLGARTLSLTDPGPPIRRLRLGQSVEGYYVSGGDNDYFKLNVENPGKSNIQIDLSAVPDADSRFQILDKDQKVLWDVNDNSKGEPESVPYFVVTEGTYYILIKGYQKNITTKYSLSTRLLGPWQEGTEAEPNDEIKRANEIKLTGRF